MIPISKTAHQSVREHVSRFLVNSFKPLYFILRRNRKPWDVTLESLAAMPAGSLGYDTAQFLLQNGFQLIPLAEFHDVYHVLLGCDSSMYGETCLQFVPLGNGKRSMPYIISTFMSAIFYPEHWGDYYREYLRGKNANKFYHWDLEQMLQIPTAEVRRMMFER